jgi:DnaK suppressor protein
MARKDSLLRLHQHLLARRDALRKALKEEIQDLSEFPSGGTGTGDAADVASDAAHHEVSSKLAELESRELLKVERALAQIRRGSYGTCEGCSKKIPMQRLNALPYTTLCITCQRDEEQGGARSGDTTAGDWDKVYDVERMHNDEQVRLSDIELDLSGSGR